jgi:hypothetical protein
MRCPRPTNSTCNSLNTTFNSHYNPCILVLIYNSDNISISININNSPRTPRKRKYLTVYKKMSFFCLMNSTDSSHHDSLQISHWIRSLECLRRPNANYWKKTTCSIFHQVLEAAVSKMKLNMTLTMKTRSHDKSTSNKTFLHFHSLKHTFQFRMRQNL